MRGKKRGAAEGGLGCFSGVVGLPLCISHSLHAIQPSCREPARRVPLIMLSGVPQRLLSRRTAFRSERGAREARENVKNYWVQVAVKIYDRVKLVSF